MQRRIIFVAILSIAALGATLSTNHHQISVAQQRPGLSADEIARRNSVEAELQSIAVVDRKVMVPMRDGKRMAADIYRPKDTSKKYPTVFSRTPYNFNFWDVRNGVVRDMSSTLDAVKRGYAYVVMNERGHFFSEGNYDILGPPLSDGDDELTWIAKQPCPTARVGLIGCSSTAEWQLAVAAQGNPALAAIIRRASAPESVALLLISSKGTGIAAAPCRCSSSPGFTASRTRCGPCSRRTLRRKI
jgi:predicted acyl esterase